MNKLLYHIIIINILLLFSCSKEKENNKYKSLDNDTSNKYSYRNNIIDFKVYGTKIIALTYYGDLMQFDIITKRFVKEFRDSISYSCLGDTIGNNLLVGKKDGSIFLLNPENFGIKFYKKIDHIPQAIFRIKDSTYGTDKLVSVAFEIRRNQKDKPRYPEQRIGKDRIIIYNLMKNDSISFLLKKSNTYITFGSDPKYKLICNDTIIFGYDRGEWGMLYGYISYKGKVLNENFFHTSPDVALININNNLYIFDNPSLIYSPNLSQAYIGQVIASKVYTKFVNPLRNRGKNNEVIISGPRTAIYQIIKNNFDNKLIVFSGSDIFETDTSFARWKNLYHFKLQNDFNLLNLKENFPLVSKAILLDANKILFSTTNYGLFIIYQGIFYRFNEK